jgi:hypothetical protein
MTNDGEKSTTQGLGKELFHAHLEEKRKLNYWGNPYIRFAGHDDCQSKESTMAEKILKRIDSICCWKKD